MRDDDVLTDAERRMRTVLRPTDEGAAAVASRALAPPLPATPRRRAALTVAVILTLLLAGAVWRASTPPQPAMHIWGSGSLVVVTRDDGRRWVVDGGHAPAPTGQYVIVVPQ